MRDGFELYMLSLIPAPRLIALQSCSWEGGHGDELEAIVQCRACCGLQKVRENSVSLCLDFWDIHTGIIIPNNVTPYNTVHTCIH